ncbi:MAG: hypothetical protein JNK29_14955, partial [Anaerolineales bacterium]|nr:hypothetical protein [Anaerolineales bacterium]
MPLPVYPTTPEPEISLTVGGDLRLAGADADEVVVEAGDAVTVEAQPDGAQVRIAALGDCSLRVPRRARLTVENVGGDARPVKDVAGPLVIGGVGGDLMLRRTGPVQAGQVGGDVSAREIAGPFSLAGAGGDVSAREIAGPFSAGFVGGDLSVREARAGAEGQAGGDVILNLNFAPDQPYRFQANGDIICRVPPDASARLEIACTGELSVDVPGARQEPAEAGTLVILGAGAAQVRLESNGDVALSDVTAASSGVAESGDDFGENLAAQIEAQVAAKMAEVERELNAQFGDLNLNLGGLGRMNAQEIAARARRAAEAARRKHEAAQRKVEAAQRKAERTSERMADRLVRPRRGWGFTASVPAAPRPNVPPRPTVPPRPPAPSEPISDQERLTILRLLEQG